MLTPYQVARGLWQRRFRPLALNRFLQWVPPGHFYSPIPSDADCQRHESLACIPGLDLHISAQLALVTALGEFMPPPFPERETAGFRFHYNNTYFSHADGAVLYGMLRHLQPSRLIEVGSGWSSAVMLDTTDCYLTTRPVFTFIEPYQPERIKALVPDADIVRVPVQDVPLEMFDSLGPNDILFIDSSHVVKAGSDVVWLIRHVLPRLRSGVVIHVHDIFWPFEYPQDWLNEGRAWNEAYMLQAFLQGNDAFEILWFTSYLTEHHRAHLERHVPLATRGGGSIWIQKVR